MKTFTCFLLMSFYVSSHAQQVQFNNDSAAYHITDTSLAGGKTDIHRKAQGWIIDKYGDAKEWIRLDDMDTGELVAELHAPITGKDTTLFTIKVSSRDRELRALVYDIRVQGNKNSTTYGDLRAGNNTQRQRAREIDKQMQSILKDLHTHIKSGKNYAAPSVDTLPD